MSRHSKPLFDIGGEFTVRRSFKFNGGTYKTGADFKWRRNCCSARKLRILYEGGFLLLPQPVTPEHNYVEPKKDKKPAKKAEPKAEKPVEKKAEEPVKVEDTSSKVEKKAEEPVKVEDKSADEDIKAFVDDQK